MATKKGISEHESVEVLDGRAKEVRRVDKGSTKYIEKRPLKGRKKGFRKGAKLLELLENSETPVPKVLHQRETYIRTESLPNNLEEAPEEKIPELSRKTGKALAKLHREINFESSINPNIWSNNQGKKWEDYLEELINDYARQSERRCRKEDFEFIAEILGGENGLGNFLASRLETPENFSLLHNDLTPENVVYEDSNVKMIDFDCSLIGDSLRDLAKTYTLFNHHIGNEAASELLKGYLSNYEIENFPQQQFLRYRAISVIERMKVSEGNDLKKYSKDLFEIIENLDYRVE